MHCRELPLALFVLMFISTSEACTSRFRITAVEGEPFYLKYCSSLPEHESGKSAVRWYKSSGSHGHVELSPSSSPRIALHGYALEFWPVELDDAGSYIFQRGNDTHNWKLNVTRRDKNSCFTKKLVVSRTVEVKQYLQVTCENRYYQNLVNRTSLYKSLPNHWDFYSTNDCKKIAENNKNPFIQKNAEFKDQGFYTCVSSLYHNGKLFNVTKTFNIAIAGDRNNINPVLFGPEVNHIEVELGKDVQLNCSALINDMDLVYWNVLKENGTNPNVYEEEGMRISTSEGKWHASKILRIENITENNLNFSYNCTVVSEGSVDTIRFILLKKAVVDEIHSLIEKSRRLIIVLSENYMSNEVRYELESGLHEALVERKIKIILIEFTPVSNFTFLPQSLELLKSHRVLKWKSDQYLSYDSRFWKNLLYLMPAKKVKPERDEAEVLPVLSES
ncbi:interleukin-18 receptor 1 isoform X5 [Choloepus didactylus]|uniref:interleukin-18 receptor 1 isoform X5 n=1 Tax=Choloepus didactylus TaxID=27675 RepID=UPI0018A0CF7B|nr:interleukin-18 receptor 1 isoform X5 [Choloepus didactylus]